MIPCMHYLERGLLWPSGQQLWHLFTDCHQILCVGSTPTTDNAEDLP